MEEKKFKQILREHTDETLRHQKMLLEEFDKKIGVVAEVQLDQRERLIRIEKKVEKIDDLEFAVKGLTRTQIVHSKKLDEHSHKLDVILEMIANNTENIELIKGMLKRKVDLEEFEALARRVTFLEKKARLV